MFGRKRVELCEWSFLEAPMRALALLQLLQLPLLPLPPPLQASASSASSAGSSCAALQHYSRPRQDVDMGMEAETEVVVVACAGAGGASGAGGAGGAGCAGGSGGGEGRAAAALLFALLRHGLRYRSARLYLPTTPPHFCQLSYISKSYMAFSEWRAAVLSYAGYASAAIAADVLQARGIFGHWSDDVFPVRLPSNPDCVIAVVVGNGSLISRISSIVRRFDPDPRNLTAILKDAGDLEEAACRWASSYRTAFDSWLGYDDSLFRIQVMICSREPDYNRTMSALTVALRWAECTNGRKNFFKLHLSQILCNNPKDVENQLELLQAKQPGAAAVLWGAEAAARPLVVFAGALANATAPSGRLDHLALAHLHLLNRCDWTRLAILSDDTSYAKSFYELLKLPENKIIHRVKKNLTAYNANSILVGLKTDDARIFFVNTEPGVAEAVLCAALRLNMTDAKKYAWILREWRWNELECDGIDANRSRINHLTIGYGWRGAETVGVADDESAACGGSTLRSKLLAATGAAAKRGSLSPLAAPLVDALLFVVRAYFDLREDTFNTSRNYSKDFSNTEVPGVVQVVRPDSNRSPYIFVDEWSNGKYERALGTWRVEEGAVREMVWRADEVCEVRAHVAPKPCWLPVGDDPFVRHCQNHIVIIVALFFVAIIAFLYIVMRRITISRLKEHLHDMSAPASRDVPVHYLVEREALEIREEIGSGSYGRVNIALLRLPGRPTDVVAVKELRSDARTVEEIEFVKEACVLASLKHENIINFIGVCAKNGPLLVIMEHAFFGDLRQYLLARRHFAERNVSRGNAEEEASFVSGRALTRLASQAAAALEYLSTRRLVHRDVRAANCLVDEHRMLKLADFGLAIELGSCSSEYASRRRALFPILWMAPESLEAGVFSSASDVWALGVLMLEIVTLGARPYGAWPPLHVFRYVLDGGHPPLPPDVTSHMRTLAMWCWQRAAEARPAAGQVCASLAALPDALQPALLAATAP